MAEIKIEDLYSKGGIPLQTQVQKNATDIANLKLDVRNTGGTPVLSAAWVQLRTKMWNGYVAADGQVLNRADYPDAWDAIQNGLVPLVGDQDWQDYPQNRGCFTQGNGSTTFRVPDYNGKSAGSLGAAFLRGDGLNAGPWDGNIQNDAIRNIVGKSTTFPWSIIGGPSNNIPDSPLYCTNEGAVQRYGDAITDSSWGNVLNIDASRSVPTAADTHPVTVTGCWAIKLFNAVQNAGEIDAKQLATQLAEAQSKISELESWPKRTLIGDVTEWNKHAWTIEHKDGFVEQGGIVSLGNEPTGHQVGYMIPFEQVWTAEVTALTDGPRASTAEANNCIVGMGNDRLILAPGQTQTPCRIIWKVTGMKKK